MDCGLLIRAPLTETEATDHGFVRKLWDEALGFVSATQNNRYSGPFTQFPQQILLQPNQALAMIGGRGSLTEPLDTLNERGMLVQLVRGSGIGLFASKASRPLRQAVLHTVRRGTDDDPGRFTVLQWFQCDRNLKRKDLLIFEDRVTVSFREYYVKLVGDNILRTQ